MSGSAASKTGTVRTSIGGFSGDLEQHMVLDIPVRGDISPLPGSIDEGNRGGHADCGFTSHSLENPGEESARGCVSQNSLESFDQAIWRTVVAIQPCASSEARPGANRGSMDAESIVQRALRFQIIAIGFEGHVEVK